MKTLKKALTIAVAFNLIALLTNGCCCFGKKHCPPQCAKCKELIVDGNFEEPQMEPQTPGSANAAYLAPLQNPPTVSFGPATSFGNNGWWHISAGTTNSPCTVTLIKNDGVRQQPHQFQPQFWNTPDTNQFVLLDYPTVGDVVTTLSQDIKTPLQVGKIYRLSFLQSAYDTMSDYGYKNPGKVLVELSPTAGGQSIYNGTFFVPAFSKWTNQIDSITIKPGDLANNPSGLFTIKFSNFIDGNLSDHSRPITLIDKVSLCDPE